MRNLDDIPTECRRCHKIFDESELEWATINRGEKWLVCSHCADAIAWANRMILLLRDCKKEFITEEKK